MSPGAEYAKPSEHPIGWRSSDEKGPLAGYASEFLQHYGRPLDAARKDVSMIRQMGANAVGICYSMPGNTARGGDQFHRSSTPASWPSPKKATSSSSRTSGVCLRRSTSRGTWRALPPSSAIRLCGFVTVGERTLLFGLAPEDLVIAIRVEGRVQIDQVNARVRELLQLLKTIAAVHNAGVEQRGGPAGSADLDRFLHLGDTLGHCQCAP